MTTHSIEASTPQAESITYRELTWMDISFPDELGMKTLFEQYGFHPLSLEDGISRSQISKLDDYENYLFLILHFPVFMSNSQALKPTWLSVFIGQDYVITLHDRFDALKNIFIECRDKEQSRLDLFADNSGYLFYRILDRLIDYCLPILDNLLKRLDEIEDRVFEDTQDDTQIIARLRRDIITFRRVTWTSRPIINELKTKIKAYTIRDLDIYFDNLIDHLNRIWDNLEESKEVVEVFKDSDFVLVTNRINRIVQTLTIISSIILPFIVVSSLYGMNVNLPGGLAKGSIVSFGILLGIMLVISGSMLYFFRRRHWI